MYIDIVMVTTENDGEHVWIYEAPPWSRLDPGTEVALPGERKRGSVISSCTVAVGSPEYTFIMNAFRLKTLQRIRGEYRLEKFFYKEESKP